MPSFYWYCSSSLALPSSHNVTELPREVMHPRKVKDSNHLVTFNGPQTPSLRRRYQRNVMLMRINVSLLVQSYSQLQSWYDVFCVVWFWPSDAAVLLASAVLPSVPVPHHVGLPPWDDNQISCSSSGNWSMVHELLEMITQCCTWGQRSVPKCRTSFLRHQWCLSSISTACIKSLFPWNDTPATILSALSVTWIFFHLCRSSYLPTLCLLSLPPKVEPSLTCRVPSGKYGWDARWETRGIRWLDTSPYTKWIESNLSPPCFGRLWEAVTFVLHSETAKQKTLLSSCQVSIRPQHRTMSFMCHTVSRLLILVHHLWCSCNVVMAMGGSHCPTTALVRLWPSWLFRNGNVHHCLEMVESSFHRNHRYSAFPQLFRT